MTIIPINKAYILEATPIDCNGDFTSSLVITYEVRKSSDNILVFNGTLSEVSGGIYIDSVTFTEENQYRVLYFSPTGWENGLEQILTEDADMSDIKALLDQIVDKVSKILGLSQSNYRLTNQVYNVNNCMTSATISIYSNASDTENQVTPIAQYSIVAVYDSNNLVTDYKVTEI